MNTKNKSSIYVGVSFKKTSNKFSSKVTYKGKTTYLGNFKTEEEAHIARVQYITKMIPKKSVVYQKEIIKNKKIKVTCLTQNQILEYLVIKHDARKHLNNMKRNYLAVLNEISKLCNVNIEHTVLPKRFRGICDARMLFSKWLKDNTTLSLNDIASVVCTVKQDHTTIMHAIEIANNLIQISDEHKQIWEQLKYNIKFTIDLRDTKYSNIKRGYVVAKYIVNKHEENLYPKVSAMNVRVAQL